ncbi:MAG: hypothetical protein EHM81_15010 [Chloroflexi bacterium]|nr:MAG: hypothetical protein EHM81_15010 [Chloroflexota bacterium]
MQKTEIAQFCEREALESAARGLGLANFILTDPNPAWRQQAEEFVVRIEKRLRMLMEMNKVS